VRLLLGQLAYLNTQPFEPFPRLRVFRAAPSEIGRLAAAAELDAGLLSAGDLIRNDRLYAPLGDARGALGIACHKRAGSVFLLSRRPPEELGGKIVEITRETSTAVLLLRLWLEHRLAIKRPEYRSGVTREHEGVLLIGDEALREREQPDPRFPYRVDLASCWQEWTGLPFVFAIWSARRSLTAAKRSQLYETIAASLERGVKRIPEIAGETAGPLGDRSAIARYLRDFVYRFGEEERRGFETFRQLVAQMNLIPVAEATNGASC
jgi:chorismate dehydratase